jgi:hypothetical protein
MVHCLFYLIQVLHERRHVHVPVKQCAEQPPENRVAEAFPDTKCLKMQDKNLKQEIHKSIHTAGVVTKKKGFFSSLSDLVKSSQDIHPIGNF